MNRFRPVPTGIDGLTLLERSEAADQRGSFGRLFCADDLRPFGWPKPVAQVNLSRTQRRGTVRGLHFQSAPHAEIKLVTCVRGRVWDVAVDLRRGSETFLQWQARELSAENRLSFLIPEGFAHGFQALADDCEIVYVHSEFYVAAADGGANPRDPRLGIAWPLPISGLSDRDAGRPMLGDDFEGLTP